MPVDQRLQSIQSSQCSNGLQPITAVIAIIIGTEAGKQAAPGRNAEQFPGRFRGAISSARCQKLLQLSPQNGGSTFRRSPQSGFQRSCLLLQPQSTQSRDQGGLLLLSQRQFTESPRRIRGSGGQAGRLSRAEDQLLGSDQYLRVLRADCSGNGNRLLRACLLYTSDAADE